MPRRIVKSATPAVMGECGIDGITFPVTLSRLTCDGCTAAADAEWSTDPDFLHLRIAGRIDINGQVIAHDGCNATIRFFGQIHPHVVSELSRVAA